MHPRPVVVARVRVAPADITRRVSIRYLDPSDGRATDVVGVLESWQDRALVVRRRDGTRAQVPEAALLAGKVVPPEVSAYGVQELAETGWLAQDREQVGAWLLRWDHDVTRRANAALVSTTVTDLPAQLERVRDWYAARGSRAGLQVPEPWQADPELAELGWVQGTAVHLMATPAAELAERLADRLAGAPAPRVELAADPDPAWLAEVDGMSEADRGTLAAILTRNADRVFATAYDPGGEVLGIGRASLDRHDGLRWSCLTNLNTAAHARRKGVARSVVAALAGWAVERGATTAYLQVEADNEAARPLYERLGFTIHHRYVYWWAPA